MSETLPMVLTRGGYTALVRVLLDQDDLMVTDIQSEPVQVGRPSANQFYRVWLTAEGEIGRVRLAVILKVMPEPTWMETWNTELDAPAEIVTLESDLLTSLPAGIIEPNLASARAREGRPAWTISNDFVDQLGNPLAEAELKLALVRLAELHALHWEATPVLDFVYPWLTRQGAWLRDAAAVYHAALNDQPDETAAGRLLAMRQPDAGENLKRFMQRLPAEDRAALTGALADPSGLIQHLEAAPTTVCHGAAFADVAAVLDDQLILADWEAIQVAPSSWDVWTFLGSLNSPALSLDEAEAFYLDAVEMTVGAVDRASWQAAYRLAPVAAFILRDLPAAAAQPELDALLPRAAAAAGALRAAGLA